MEAVRQQFAECSQCLGVPVFSADIEAKRIQDNDPDMKDKINSLAGKDLYSSGKLDREELARLIFNNKDLLWEVNSIVHPVVFNYFRKWVAMQDAPYSIMEAAILFESGAYRYDGQNCNCRYSIGRKN